MHFGEMPQYSAGLSCVVTIIIIIVMLHYCHYTVKACCVGFFFYIFHYFKCGLGSQVKMAMVEKKKKK